MRSLISVIIPVYNHAETLAACLETVVLQTREHDLQVIMVNDGSTDNFKETLASLLGNYSGIRALEPKVINQENKGANAARNRGWQEATGDYVIFLDADTRCYPGMFAEMLVALETNEAASYAYSQFKFGWKKMKSQDFDPTALRCNNYIDVSSLIRRSALEGVVKPFDESLKRFQDWDLWLTLLKQNKVGIFIPKVLYQKIVGRRIGYSHWLPSFIYRLPWKTKRVAAFDQAKTIVLKKHHLL